MEKGNLEGYTSWFCWPNGQKWKYSGEILDGKPHGKGKMTWDGGTVYEGEFVNGKRYGKGKITYNDNDVYEGEWADDEMKGIGKMIFLDKKKQEHVYEGEWYGNCMDGNGKLKLANGEIYEGEWALDEFIKTKGKTSFKYLFKCKFDKHDFVSTGGIGFGSGFARIFNECSFCGEKITEDR